MRYFAKRSSPSEQTRVIDLGGTPYNWTLLERCPIVTIINTDAIVIEPNLPMTAIRANAKMVPFPDMSFDICYSNSLIEHVGDAASVEAFGREVHRLATQYFVQTPNKWFPVEPHLLCIFIQWLPWRIKRRLMRWFSLWGWMTKATQAETDRMLAGIRLLSYRDMAALFPDAEIKRERFLGITKSLIAIKA